MKDWPVATARRLGLGGAVEFTPARVGVTLHVPCCRGHVVDVKVDRGLNPEGVAKRMLSKGWTMGHRLTCPKHARKPKKETPEVPENVTPISAAPAALVPTAAAERAKQTASTAAAGRAKRMVYMALEDYYDEANKRYKPGYSDATIAKECGISEATVKNIREESFGPLAAPHDFARLEEDLAQVELHAQQRHEQFMQEVILLRQRLDRLVSKNGWAE